MLLTPPAEMIYLPNPKRTRNDVEAAEQADQTFLLHNLVSDLPLCFEPVSRLLRAHLPLSWLASASPRDHLLPGTLLHGQVKPMGGWEYAVLVVRHIPNGGLVVLEKVEDDCFVVHPLQPFVSDKWVQDAAVGAAPAVSLQMMLHYLPTPEKVPDNGRERTLSAHSESVLSVPKNRKGAVARLSILSHQADVSRRPSSPQTEKIPIQAVTETSSGVPENPGGESATSTSRPEEVATTVNSDISIVQPEEPLKAPVEMPNDMLSPVYLRQRYLDHLYTTKTSLAYYAKGPLSRARARARAPDSSISLSDLATFYRNSIIPMKRMDLKYKESIQHAIKQHVSRDLNSTLSKKTSRRTKLGKDGFWPIEHEFVARWWEARHLGSSSSPEQQSHSMRDAIASLRMREAQMQMVLMLEALSIEAKQKDSTAGIQPVPKNADIKAESIELDSVPEKQQAKSKKQRNLEADLEVVADRLCIWHSVGLEGEYHVVENGVPNDKEDPEHPKDRLRNFCLHVLIPFYGSRLPHLCKILCKTLAGPEVFEHAAKTTQVKDAGKMTAPGTSVKRRVPSASGKELARTLAVDGTPQPPPPGLTRSSTLPSLPKFKREASELSQRPPSRSSRQPSVNFVNREIDLVADAQATASKKRKLDRVASHKQELAAAIEALKKPNRQTASSAYMDEVEQRKPDSKNTSILITATPKGNRRKALDCIGAERIMQPMFDGDRAILSSGQKPRSAGTFGTTGRSSAKKKAVLAAIHDTPSKGTSRRSNRPGLVEDSTANASLAKSASVDEALILSTPVKDQPTRSQTSFNIPTARLVNRDSQAQTGFELPDLALKTMNRAMAMPVPSTIYDTLGWNDEYDV